MLLLLVLCYHSHRHQCISVFAILYYWYVFRVYIYIVYLVYLWWQYLIFNFSVIDCRLELCLTLICVASNSTHPLTCVALEPTTLYRMKFCKLHVSSFTLQKTINSHNGSYHSFQQLKTCDLVFYGMLFSAIEWLKECSPTPILICLSVNVLMAKLRTPSYPPIFWKKCTILEKLSFTFEASHFQHFLFGFTLFVQTCVSFFRSSIFHAFFICRHYILSFALYLRLCSFVPMGYGYPCLEPLVCADNFNTYISNQ